MLPTPVTHTPNENKQICGGDDNCITAETCRNENFMVLITLYIVNINLLMSREDWLNSWSGGDALILSPQAMNWKGKKQK